MSSPAKYAVSWRTTSGKGSSVAATRTPKDSSAGPVALPGHVEAAEDAVRSATRVSGP